MTKTLVRFPDSIRKTLKSLNRDQGVTYRKIATRKPYNGIPPGTLCAIANGYPVPKRWREKLGLPELKTVSGCIKCGMVHTTKRCTGTNHRPRPPRLAIRLDNPESAARSIKGHMDRAVIAELIDLLKDGR